jgi:hypothetical protein
METDIAGQPSGTGFTNGTRDVAYAGQTQS